MRQYAKVISVTDNHAKVMIRKHSACGKCGKCSSDNNMTVVVNNHLNAKIGDMVILEMEEGNLLNAAILIYFVPLVGLIAGYLLGVGLGFVTELSKIILGLLLFILSFLGARKFGKRQQDEYKVKIISIIN